MSSSTGLTVGNAGTFDLGGANGERSVGSLAGAGNVNLGANRLNVGGNHDSTTFAGAIDGTGGLNKHGSGTLTLSGSNTYQGSTTVRGGTLALRDTGVLVGSTALTVDSGGSFDLSGANGDRSVGSLAGAGDVNLGGNRLIVGGNHESTTFAGAIGGTGGLTKNGSGTLTLSGNNTYQASTTVNSGGLTMAAGSSLTSHQITVASGAALDGSGHIAGTVTLADGAHLALFTGSTLTVGGLTLSTDSQLDASLGAPVAGGGSELLKVNGDLTLAGKLNVTDAGQFGVGLYRLIDYAGAMTQSGNGLTLASLPSAFVAGQLQLQTAVNNQVNLLVNPASNPGGNPGTPTTPAIQFWNGGKTNADGTIGGGSGVWGPATNWTDVSGTQSQAGSGSAFAVFGGQSGDVTVLGGQAFTGLQFLSNYQLSAGTGGQLEVINGVDGRAAVRVDPGVTATLNVSLTGSGSLDKRDRGTLVLNGANTFTGGTQLQGGTLVVGHDGALGTGLLSITGAATLGSQQSISLANNVKLDAGLQVGASGRLQLNGNVQGAGSLTMGGTGTLVLSGNNTYTGGTTVAAGTLRSGSAGGLVNNTAYAVAAGATLDLNGHALQASSLDGAGTVALGTGNLTVANADGIQSSFGGQVQGSGQLIKQGAGTLSLGGANTFSGGVALKQGNIVLGNAQGLGSGTLEMDDGSAIYLGANGMQIANNLHMTGSNDPIIDTGSNDGTWAGAITGGGFLTKQGQGTLTLTNTGNAYTGATEVAQGTLLAGASKVLSQASAHSVARGASLDVGGWSQTVASLSNSGTVNLGSSAVGATPGATLTVTGPYVGNNGKLNLSTVLGGSDSATDRLLLNGPTAVASGNTTVHIANAGGLGAQTTGSGIEVIGTTNGASLQPGTFTLAGGHVDAGAYEYRLFQTGQGASLQSNTTAPVDPTPPVEPIEPTPPVTPTPVTPAYRAEVPLLAALPAQLRQADNAMLGGMRKRMGDDTTQGKVNLADGLSGRRVWGRVLRIDPRTQQQGTVSQQSQGHLAGFQTGLDVYADQSVKAGIYVGQLEGNLGVSGFASGEQNKKVGFNRLTSRYLGVYGTWQHDSGLYADAVLQGAGYRSDLNLAGKNSSARVQGHGWQMSLEAGQSIDLGSGWQIEPQAQLIYRKLSLDDTTLDLTTVQHRADQDWTLRLGTRIKGSFSTKAGVLQPHASLNVYKASNTTDVARFVTPAAATDIVSKGGYTTTELAAGATLRLSASTSLYGEFGKLWANAGASRVGSGLQASLGVKVRW